MNIHLPAILMFTRGTRFWHTAIYTCVMWNYSAVVKLLCSSETIVYLWPDWLGLATAHYHLAIWWGPSQKPNDDEPCDLRSHHIWPPPWGKAIRTYPSASERYFSLFIGITWCNSWVMFTISLLTAALIHSIHIMYIHICIHTLIFAVIFTVVYLSWKPGGWQSSRGFGRSAPQRLQLLRRVAWDCDVPRGVGCCGRATSWNTELKK